MASFTVRESTIDLTYVNLSFFTSKKSQLEEIFTAPPLILKIPGDSNNRLPVLRVLVVRVTWALVLQVGLVVMGGGVGVVAVLVDLIQTPDDEKTCHFYM